MFDIFYQQLDPLDHLERATSSQLHYLFVEHMMLRNIRKQIDRVLPARELLSDLKPTL